MHVIGIDPGATGALALLEDDVILDVVDMPVFVTAVGTTRQSQMNIPALVSIFNGWIDRVLERRGLKDDPGTYEGLLNCYMEQVGPTPGKSPVMMFRFGEGFGILKGIISVLGIPLTLVHPAVWKRVMRCSREKDEARLLACQTFPAFSASFSKGKDHNRAESSLIGLYGIRQIRGEGYAPARVPISTRRR